MKKKLDISLIFFYFAIAVSVFGYGVVVGLYKIFPYEQILYMKDSAFLVVEEAGMWSKTKPSKHIYESRYDGEGVTRIDKKRMAPGVTLITSMFDGDLTLRLINDDGSIIKQWPALIFDIWDNFDHLSPERRPKSNWNTLFGGAILFPDGSIVFNLEGLVKMDRCGKVLWTMPSATHHSVEPSNDGGFWAGGQRYITEETKHPPFVTPYYEDTILKISSNGAMLQELSIMDLLIKNDLQALIFSNNRSIKHNSEQDITHLNDIEELTEKVASAFPQFDAGDLLISIRQPNMVFVVDPDTEEIKWYRVGPWIQQHDADFQHDGTITAFDNNYDGTQDGSVFGGSRIIRVNPVTGESEIVYGGNEDEPMYTSTQGSHQFLDNGNLLIIETRSGRVLEVDEKGEIVWEFINRYSKDEVVRISGATRYPENYLKVDDWECGKEF